MRRANQRSGGPSRAAGGGSSSGGGPGVGSDTTCRRCDKSWCPFFVSGYDLTVSCQGYGLQDRGENTLNPNSADVALPSASDRAAAQRDDRPQQKVQATRDRVSGAGLECFYRSLLKGLARLGEAWAHSGDAQLQSLRKQHAARLRQRDAGAIRVGAPPAWQRLDALLAGNGESIADLAQQALSGGTARGQGGTEMSAVSADLFGVDCYFFRSVPNERGAFVLLEVPLWVRVVCGEARGAWPWAADRRGAPRRGHGDGSATRDVVHAWTSRPFARRRL